MCIKHSLAKEGREMVFNDVKFSIQNHGFFCSNLIAN